MISIVDIFFIFSVNNLAHKGLMPHLLEANKLIWIIASNILMKRTNHEGFDVFKVSSMLYLCCNVYNMTWHPKVLTHLSLHKMANIFKCTFMNEKFCISISISLKFVPKGPVDNKTVLVQIMACCKTGDKPLSEPMLTQFTDAYMRH